MKFTKPLKDKLSGKLRSLLYCQSTSQLSTQLYRQLVLQLHWHQLNNQLRTEQIKKND